jgi:hypothetical protein
LFKRIALSIVCAGLALNLCGCVALLAGAVGGGVGTAVWLSGKLVYETGVPFEEALRASKEGLRDKAMLIRKETVKSDMAQLLSTYYDGSTVWVDIHRISPSVSRIEVRVGAKGNKAAARILMDSIAVHLPERR